MASGRVSKVKGKVLDTPTVPSIGTATAGGESASVAFTASTKGGPAFTYTAISNPGSITGTGSSSPVVVTGLTANTAYTFTVRGNNPTGSSEYSSASNSATPFELTAFEFIATAVPTTSGQSEVIFTSIPNTYEHLFLTWQIMGVTNGDVYIDLNNTTGVTNQMGWNGSVGQGAIANTYTGYVNYSANVSSSYPHFGYAYINGYKGSARKNVLSWNATVRNNVTEVNQVMTDFNFTTAVKDLRVGVSSGGFGTNSKLALYGIKSS